MTGTEASWSTKPFVIWSFEKKKEKKANPKLESHTIFDGERGEREVDPHLHEEKDSCCGLKDIRGREKGRRCRYRHVEWREN